MLSKSANTPSQREIAARKHITSVKLSKADMEKATLVANYSPLVHVFTHLKLTMHIYEFRLDVEDTDDADLDCAGQPARKWVDTASVDAETLSTGMRKCWALCNPL